MNFITASIRIGREAIDGTSLGHFKSLTFPTKRNIVFRVLLVAFQAGLIGCLVSLNLAIIFLSAGIISFAYYSNRQWVPSPLVDAILGLRPILRKLEEIRRERNLAEMRRHYDEYVARTRVPDLLEGERLLGDIEEELENDNNYNEAERDLLLMGAQLHKAKMQEAVFPRS